MTNIVDTNKNNINHLTVTETLFTSTEGMDSREIARLTGKRHTNIVRDIRKMLTELKLELSIFERKYTDPNGVERVCFVLPFDECLTLISGYNVLLRNAIIKRWRELEGFTSSTLSLGTADEECDVKIPIIRALLGFGRRLRTRCFGHANKNASSALV